MGLSDRCLLSKGGRQPSDWMGAVTGSEAALVGAGLASSIGVGNFSGEVVGEDFVVGKVEGTFDESMLLRGNGNSRGGGIGRMLVAPSCRVGWAAIAAVTIQGRRHAERVR